MRTKRTALAAAISLLTGGLSTIGLAAGPALADNTTAALPITGYASLLVDGPAQHLFLSGGSGSTAITVTDLAGGNATTITGENGATGLARSADGSTVYAALADADAVVAIDADTLQEKARWQLPSGSAPASVTVSGSTVWYSYATAAGRGALGSIDTAAADASPTPLTGPGDAVDFAHAPRLSSAAGRLFAHDPDNGRTVTLDVSGSTPLLVQDHTAAAGLGATSQALSPDGTVAILASPSAAAAQSVSTGDAATALRVYGTGGVGPSAVATAPDGTVAVGATGPAGTQVYTYSQAVLLPIRTTGLGDGSLLPDGLAWQSDGFGLYAVTRSPAGDYQLHVLDDASVADVQAGIGGPQAPTATVPYELAGRFTSRRPLPAGTVVHVSEDGVRLPDVRLNALRAFQLTVVHPLPGHHEYTVSYDGDRVHTPASASLALDVRQASPQLSVSANASVLRYGSTATVTVHLGARNSPRTVSVYATPYHGRRTLIRTGSVDAYGNLRVGYRPTVATTFTADFAGTAAFTAATASVAVQVHAAVSLGQRGWYTSTTSTGGTRYRVYHHTAHPVLTAAVAPLKAGECVTFELQEYLNGAWRTVKASGCHKLNSKSVAAESLTLPRNATGHKFRARALYHRSSTDLANLNQASDWQYLAVRT